MESVSIEAIFSHSYKALNETNLRLEFTPTKLSGTDVSLHSWLSNHQVNYVSVSFWENEAREGNGDDLLPRITITAPSSSEDARQA